MTKFFHNLDPVTILGLARKALASKEVRYREGLYVTATHLGHVADAAVALLLETFVHISWEETEFTPVHCVGKLVYFKAERPSGRPLVGKGPQGFIRLKEANGSKLSSVPISVGRLHGDIVAHITQSVPWVNPPKDRLPFISGSVLDPYEIWKNLAHMVGGIDALIFILGHILSQGAMNEIREDLRMLNMI